MNNPAEVTYCAMCGKPLTRNDYIVRTMIHQVDCRNAKTCPAYYRTTIIEAYTDMLARFHLIPLYDTRTGEPLTVCIE